MAFGYDRAITIFSPEGRILQVEYARQAVKSGSTAIGFVAKDGVAIVADKRLHGKLIVNRSVEKIFIIDDHIIATFSGFIPDGRVLLDKARIIAQEYKMTFGSPIDILSLVKEIGDIKQLYTQYGGIRPFGVSLIFTGIDADGEAKLFVTDPSGLYYQYYAAVIGEGENKISNLLEEKYNRNISVKEAIKLGIDLLKEVLKDNFTFDRVIVGYIKIGEKPTLLEEEEVKRLYEES